MSKEKLSPTERRLGTLSDYKKTFTTPHGSRVLRRMMKECGMMDPSFVEGDPSATAFNEGRRSAVLDVCNRLKIDIVRMSKELTTQSPDDDDYIE